MGSPDVKRKDLTPQPPSLQGKGELDFSLRNVQFVPPFLRAARGIEPEREKPCYALLKSIGEGFAKNLLSSRPDGIGARTSV